MNLIGSKVKHRKFGEGVIVEVKDEYVSVDFNGVIKIFLIETIETFFSFEDENIRNAAREAANEIKEKKQSQSQKITELKTKVKLKTVKTQASFHNKRIKYERVITFIDPAPVHLNSVSKNDRELVLGIFDACDKETQTLYETFEPKMFYPNFTSHSRSKYCVGYLTKHLGVYVFRVFSRNDVYKKRVRSGITVMESNTAEVLRAFQINGKFYYFSKNITLSMGYYNNTDRFPEWCESEMGTKVLLNRVACNCDCGYLNGYVADNNLNIKAFMYVRLLLLALVNNKAEIVFKNKVFASTVGISNLADYLEEFSPKQIEFACKNDVINSLPVIKSHGLYDVPILKEMEKIMRARGWYGSIYRYMVRIFKVLNFDTSDLMKRLVRFVRTVEFLDTDIYYDYILEISNQNGITIKDFFDKDYIERHNVLLELRQRRYTLQEEKKYSLVAKELSWIDREYNGYFIVVPKNIKAFKEEGDIQHNCVYQLGYYNAVINKKSIIVFLRKDKNLPYVTIEYDYETFEVLQARGKYNQRLNKDLYQYVVDLGKILFFEKDSMQ